jgi:phosphatidate cytidylyltransferase
MILPRIITAVIGIPLVVLAVYFGGIPFFLLMAGVVFMSLREYYILAGYGKYGFQPVIGTICGMALFVSLYLNGTQLGSLTANHGTAALISLMLIPIFLREMLRSGPERSIERISVTFFGAFFIPWTLGHLVLIRSLRPAGMEYVFFLFIVIWMLDTGAYIVGRKFGRNTLAAMVSPKKTLEGAAGGALTGIFTAMLCKIIFLNSVMTLPEAAALGLIITAVSQFSDLAESMIKRDVGVKDSADLLPGHGGMLDRFDSFLFTSPLIYYYLTIFKGN